MAITIGGGFRISDINPIDDRFVVSSSEDRFALEQSRVFEGLTIYATSSDEYFILGDKSNYSNANGWHKVLLSDLGSTSFSITASIISASGAITASNLSGTNTGDQDLSSLASITQLNNSSSTLQSNINTKANIANPSFTGAVTASIISASGDITSTNITASGAITSTNITASGDIISSNISASGHISASELFVSGDTNMLGNLALPNIPDVSSSLAAAIEGAGNLETVLTNGNTATIAIEIRKSGVAFSGSGGGHITASEAWFESGSNIGPAEDVNYNDGAFNFTENTKIGTAIDKMNEALAGLIPAEAPEIQYLGDNEATSFVPAKSNLPATYVQLGSTSSLPSILRGQVIPNNAGGNGDGGDYDLGVISSSTLFLTLDAIPNKAVIQNGSPAVNYSASAFGKANEGGLEVYVNKSIEGVLPFPNVTLDLTTTPEATQSIKNGVTIAVTETSSGFFGTGISFPSFVNRTSSIQIDPSAQVSGSNTLIIRHSIGSTNYKTNYIRWVNAQDAVEVVTSSAGASLSADGDETNLARYHSGIKYHVGYYATYSLESHNVYSRTYSNSSDDLELKVQGNNLQRYKQISQSCFIDVGASAVTSSVITNATSTNESLTASLCDIPSANSQIPTHSISFKNRGGLTNSSAIYGSMISANNDTTAGILKIQLGKIKLVPDRNFNNSLNKTDICLVTSSGWLVDARLYNDSNHTLQREIFVTESYRLIPGDYGTQASVTNVNNRWIDTQNILQVDASPFFKNDNYTASLLTMPRWEAGGYNGNSTSGMLVYPNGSSVPQTGAFNNITNGWVSLGGNPNYSGLDGIKFYYRYFRNVSGNDLSTFNIKISCWDNTISVRRNGSGFSTSGCQISIKHPGGTGWLDVGADNSQNSTDNLTVDNASAYLGTKPTISTAGVNFNISVGNTATPNQVANNEYLLLRIQAFDVFQREFKEIRITDFE